MSLFGSLYDDDGGDQPETAADEHGAPADLVDEGTSLHDFAAAAFGAPDALASSEPSTPAPPPPEPSAPAPPPPVLSMGEQSAASARAELTSLSSLATLASTAPAVPQVEAPQEEAPSEPDEPEQDASDRERTTSSVPALAEQALALSDDLLPRGGSPSNLALPSGRLKDVAVILLAALVGFVAFKVLIPADSSDPAPANEASAPASAPADSPAGAQVPRTPSEAIEAAADAGAALDLQRATMGATMVYAERATFELTLDEWRQYVDGVQVVGGGSTEPAKGVVLVSSDADAACFETASAGKVVAAGVTAEGTWYTTGPSAGLCSLDPAVISGWSPSLL